MSSTIRIAYRGLGHVLATAVIAAGGWLAVAPAAGQELVTVLANVDRGPFAPPVGFLHGVDHTLHYPDASMVAALRPRAWRLSKYQTYEFVAPFDDVRSTYIVSDPYGWSVGYPNAAPWEDWAAWEDYVRGIVITRSAWFPAHPVAWWDIWNEPDHPYFWHGTYEQLLELFARSVAAVKAQDPDAQVVGPSLSCFDPDAPGLENIIDFLVDLDTMYGVRLDAVSWHENGGACTGGLDPREIVTNAQALRAALLEHFGPDYQPPLHINEYTGGAVHLSPGWNVGYLYNLVEARIDAAMRACWYTCQDDGGGPFGYSACWAGLNGMFMFDDATPQAAYWVYRAVADMDGRDRVVTLGPSLTNALATRDDPSLEIRVLVGRYGTGGQAADVIVRVTGYPWAYEQVLVEIARIPYTWGWCGQTPLNDPLPAGPVSVSSGLLPVEGNAIDVALPAFADGEAYTVILSPPPCPGDVDGDGTVGVGDFLALLAAWGPNPGHPADLDVDGHVGVSDFLLLLALWGPCA